MIPLSGVEGVAEAAVEGVAEGGGESRFSNVATGGCDEQNGM